MSYHTFSSWRISDGYDPEVVDEIVRGLNEMKTYTVHGTYMDNCYRPFCQVDYLIMMIGLQLDKTDISILKKEENIEILLSYFRIIPDEGIKRIVLKVLEKIENGIFDNS